MRSIDIKKWSCRKCIVRLRQGSILFCSSVRTSYGEEMRGLVEAQLLGTEYQIALLPKEIHSIRKMRK